MEFITYVVIAVLAAYVGWFARGIVIISNLARDPDHIIKMLEQIKKINQEEELGNNTADGGVEVEPEQVGNVWYAYEKDTGQFLAQGTSLEDAIKSACDRFPEKTFWYKNPKQFSQTA
jgi:hypothetical protein